MADARARVRARAHACAMRGLFPPAATAGLRRSPRLACARAPQVDHGCLGATFDLDNYDAMVVLSHNGAFAKLHRV